MTHVCELKKSPSLPCLGTPRNRYQRLKAKLQKLALVSEENPHGLLHFKSPYALREERKRQLLAYPGTIHPFSILRKWYDIYLIYLYASLLITKPLEGCFMTPRRYGLLPGFKEYALFTDALSLIDIVMNFFTGYFIHPSEVVELRRSLIARRYLMGPFWVCDVLSSVPKAIFHYKPFMKINNVVEIVGFINIMCLFKIVRLSSLVLYVSRMSAYVRRGSSSKVLTLCNIVILVYATHWLACLHFGVSKTIRFYFWPDRKKDTWIYSTGVSNSSTSTQYWHSFFKSTAYILGVQITNIYHKQLPEEYIMGIITYIVGKFLVVYAWVFMAVAILNSRSINIKFAELINQLDEYMAQKQLPLNLRKRISHYYYFKYQMKYVKEESIVSLLSNNLKRDINMHLCSSLVKKVSLFADLNSAEVGKLIAHLMPEIFLPNDTIFTSGSYGNDMYFLSSGTVAVYTRSGKEVCHLEDGAYFGELSLIIQEQIRVATVVAIETCQVYRLSKKDFDICLLSNKRVRDRILSTADHKLKYFKRIEEGYWKVLFKKTFQEG